ncbi:hypothetical protein VNI00_015112 [Paramarasmius palmivorus]|uniref:Uncharacterized protein n=1 Tax=Paramarasmius palmivorus TaxID=297713 RepID=A0AAW0BNM2_9AGAR
MLKPIIAGLAFLLRTNALTVMDVNPTTVSLGGGAIMLNITWRKWDAGDFQFAFVLNPSGTRSNLLQAPSQVGLDVVSRVTFGPLSPGWVVQFTLLS